jgi:hypothetical protein
MKRVLVFGGLMGLMLVCGCGKKASSGPNAAGWSGFDPEQGKFSVAMPGTPTEKPLKGLAGKAWTSTADGLTYSVGYEALQVPAGATGTDQVEAWMDNDVDVLLIREGGTLTGQTKPLMVGSLPGREVDIDVDGKTVRRIRMCVAGDRLYSGGRIRTGRQSRHVRGQRLPRFVQAGEVASLRLSSLTVSSPVGAGPPTS